MSVSSVLSAIAPQFDGDVNRSTHIQLATQRTSRECFGVNYEYAIALRAAHTLTLTSRAGTSMGSGGEITSMREGDLSISFSTSKSSSSDLPATTYGQQLQELIKGNIIVADITGRCTPC